MRGERARDRRGAATVDALTELGDVEGVGFPTTRAAWQNAGFARVGVRTTSTSSQNATTRRAWRCSAATARAWSTLDVTCARSNCARLIGINSEGSSTG